MISLSNETFADRTLETLRSFFLLDSAVGRLRFALFSLDVFLVGSAGVRQQEPKSTIVFQLGLPGDLLHDSIFDGHAFWNTWNIRTWN